MILENDYTAGLFNGDTGLVLPTPEGLRVYFSGQEGFRTFSPARLPRHETCYAMTVHKSQGSEFDHAVLVLPETPCPILSRELLYTALTRARSRFTLIGTDWALKLRADIKTTRVRIILRLSEWSARAEFCRRDSNSSKSGTCGMRESTVSFSLSLLFPRSKSNV